MLSAQARLSRPFYALLSLPATAMGFALSVQIAALSWLLATRHGLAIHDIGLVWAAGPVAGILGQLIIGLLSDRAWFWNGRRRGFIVIGGIVAALMLLALPGIGVIAAHTDRVGVLGIAIAVALSLDLAINVGFNPTRSLIADVTPAGPARLRGYTWMQTVSGSFSVLAYLVGAVFGNDVLIYVGAGLVLALSTIPPLLIEEPRRLAAPEAAAAVSARAALVTIKPLWGFLGYGVYGLASRAAGWAPGHYWVEAACAAATALWVGQALVRRGGKSAEHADAAFAKALAAHAFAWVGVQSMFIYMFSWAEFALPALDGHDLGRLVSGAFLALTAVSALAPVAILQPLAERIGRVRAHQLSLSVMVAGYAGIALAEHAAWTLYGMMILIGVGWASTISLPFAIFSQLVDQRRMGLYMGLFNLSVVLPQLVASLGVGAWVSQLEDKDMLFALCAGSVAASAALWSAVPEPRASGRPG